MKLTIDKDKYSFYLRVGLAYLLVFLVEIWITNPETFLVRAVNTIWRTPYIIFINYVFLEYVLPSIKLTWGRMLITPLLLIGQIFLYSAGLYIWRSIGIALGIHTSLVTHDSVSKLMGEQTGVGMFSLFFFGVIKHVYDYRKLRKSAQQLRIEKQEAELNYLKSQTNPHFLFNTLNNIYSLARDKSDAAPESILRLSKILRFMLYETGGDYIAIDQELKIIGDYIALEKLRYDESLRVNFNHDIEDVKQALPPLLLIPLVENAFKHGVSETRDQPFIDIHLAVKNRQLVYIVQNSTETVTEKVDVKENIGLSNLRRQLELLYTDYSLTVHLADSVFTATLKINLATHV